MGPVGGRAAAGAAAAGHRAHTGPLHRGVREADRRVVLIVAVDFAVPVEVAFDYLADPRNRPEWQSSLRRVELLRGQHPVIGQTWLDVTRVGVRPRMETLRLQRPTVWTERGVWRGIEATLTLWFTAAGRGCRVDADLSVSGRGLARPLGPALARIAPYAVRSDLRRAARILSERAAEQ